MVLPAPVTPDVSPSGHPVTLWKDKWNSDDGTMRLIKNSGLLVIWEEGHTFFS